MHSLLSNDIVALQRLDSTSLDLAGPHRHLYDCHSGARPPGGGHCPAGLPLAAAGLAGEEGDGRAAGVEQAHSAQFAARSCGCTFPRCAIPQQHGENHLVPTDPLTDLERLM